MSVLVFGRGMLGPRIARVVPHALLHGADIADLGAVRAALAAHRPHAVVNAAGRTGTPNVDWCEDHVFETWRSNTVGPITLAQACAEAGVYLLHLGSGCVFYGPSPHPGGWREHDPANPESTYARSKYAADLALGSLPGVAVLRLRMPFDAIPGPRNLITRLAAYPQVLDCVNSLTAVEDLLALIPPLLELRPQGVLHATNPGAVSHRELLARYRDLVDPTHRCVFVGEEALRASGRTRAPRSSCALADTRLAALGLALRPIEDALDRALRGYALALSHQRAQGVAE